LIEGEVEGDIEASMKDPELSGHMITLPDCSNSTDRDKHVIETAIFKSVEVNDTSR